MRKPDLILQLFFCFLIFSLSSCVDHDYDFDDDKLDKDAVFSPDGVNIPIGDVERISILNEFRKQYEGDNEIQVDGNGVIFITYDGEIPIEFPEFETPTFVDFETQPVYVERIGENGNVLPGEYSFVTPQKTDYEIEPPVFHNEQQELDISVRTIHFDSYPLDLTFYLSDLTVLPGGEGKIVLFLDFPPNFVLADGQKRIEREIDIHRLNSNGFYTIPHIAEIQSYTYTGQDIVLTYGMDLKVTSDISIQTDSPTFYMTLSARNQSIRTNRLDCFVEGREVIDGTIDGFDDLTNSFDQSILEFINPSVLTAIITNLACDFQMDMELTALNNKAVIRNLYYEKPSVNYPQKRVTEYYLAPLNEGNPSDEAPWEKYALDNLFKSFIPDEIDYKIITHFDSEVVLYPTELDISANYSFKLPFEFTRIDLSISDISEDLFSENIYNDVFKYVQDNLILEADNVDILIGDEDINLSVSAVILDENNMPLIRLEDVLTEDNKIFASIQGEDIKKMKDARHLEFIFHIVGKGAITEDDYIDITGVRIVSNGGIHIDF